MSEQSPTLTDLAERGAFGPLEDRWLEAIDAAGDARDDLLGALEVLGKRDASDRAAALAWMWLASEKEKAEPADLLALGRDLFLRCGANEQLREEVLRLYRELFADRPGFDQLLELSGLSGDKSAMRALRTLEICLNLNVGDYLVSRSEERAAEVAEIDPDSQMYTLRSPRGQEMFDADQLALKYDPVDANDFRVLVQLHPEKVGEMLEADPVPLVIGILKSHGGRIDSDQLEHLLSPSFIPDDRWRKWWNSAKRELRKCPYVVLEGKTRVMLTYHPEGRSLEEEIVPQWEAADTAAQRMSVIDGYLREAKARRVKTKPAMVERMHRDLMNRYNTARGAPSEALTEALIIDRLAGSGALPAGAKTPARSLLAESPDVISLITGLDEPRLAVQAVECLPEARPEDWPDVAARMLPIAPIETCDLLARLLAEAGHRERLDEAVRRIPEDFLNHIDALCWLWRGPAVECPDVIAPRDLLLRLLDHLSSLSISDKTPKEVLRNARLKFRGAISHAKYQRYRQVIGEMDSGLASTVHRTIDRLDGLGQVVRSDLLRIILDTHPGLIKPKARIDPWTDDQTIFCTQQGMRKRQEELDYLTKVKIPENAKAIGEAAARGDLSENSEYKFALEERDLLQARVAGIQNELVLGRLVTADDINTDQVNIGTRVTLRGLDNDQRHEITILGPWEADMDNNVLNYRAPLCQKLRDLRIGDDVALELDGTERQYRIESIANALAG